MPIARSVLLGAAAVMLFACAPPPAPPPAAPAVPPVTMDGTYSGTSTRFQADSRVCPHPGLVTLYVQHQQFSYRWDHAIWVDSSIDADGTVHGQADRITLVGKWDGTKLEGDVTNGACGVHFTVKQHAS